MAQQRHEDIFAMLKNRFPHLDTGIVNPEATFSQNLENIISQLNIPQSVSTPQQITHMKQAVDSQELKIQKSLINEQDILGNISNRINVRRNRPNNTLHISEDEESWGQENGLSGDLMGNIISEIWEFGGHCHNRDWFTH